MKKAAALLSILPMWMMVSSQVQVDQPIDLTGGSGLRKVTNLELPVAGTDAANKNYVDNAVAATGGGGPTMLSNESGTAMHLGDAIRYCRNLTEGGYTDWRLPTYSEFIAAASTDDTVSNDNSSNFCHIGTSDSGSYSLGSNSGATNYVHFGIRLSDGARSTDYTGSGYSFPNYWVRCVR
jgi:hypothetical protein